MFDFSDVTTAAGTTTTIKVADASLYDVNDVIEYENDAVPRIVTDANTTSDIVTFANDALDANSASNKSVYNWGPGVSDVNEDYHLTDANSPCFNAGDPNGDYAGQTDIDGEPRAMGDCNEIVDMGADEVYYPSCWNCLTQCYADADCSGTVDDEDKDILMPAFNTAYGDPNYNPCPDFNRDGYVNILDVLIMRVYYETSPDPNCDCGGTWPPQ